MDKMQLFCTHIRAALTCYEDYNRKMYNAFVVGN